MNEQTFWNSPLGEWIKDCLCENFGIVLESEWRDSTMHKSTILYKELCNGLALNLLFNYITRNTFNKSDCENFDCQAHSSEYFVNNTNNNKQFYNLNEIPCIYCKFNKSNVKISCKNNETFTNNESQTALQQTPFFITLVKQLRYFHILLQKLRQFYRANLLCLISLPDSTFIVQHPVSEISGHEMLKLIGFLLGAAVKSNQREIFIRRIKTMRPQLQHALIEEIQRVTTNGECVMNLESLQQLIEENSLNFSSENDSGNESVENKENTEDEKRINDKKNKQKVLASLIDCLVKEHDDYASALLDLIANSTTMSKSLQKQQNKNDEYTTSTESTSNIPLINFTIKQSNDSDLIHEKITNNYDACAISPVINENTTSSSREMLDSIALSCSTSTNSLLPPISPFNALQSSSERHVSIVEFAALKGELRKLKNENEDKSDLIMDLQEDNEKKDAQILKLQSERLELIKDARAAKDYRDEVDCMQHKLMKLERIEAENEKLKSKLTEINFYKSRVNSLKEDNNVVQETCRVMEEQLEQCQKKLSMYLEIESRMIESQANVKSLQFDLAKTRERVEDLLIENGRLERESKEYAQKCLELERRLEFAVATNSPREITNNSLTNVQDSINNSFSQINDSSLSAQLDACNQSQILELQLENRKLKSQIENNKNISNTIELFELDTELNETKNFLQEQKNENIKLIEEIETLKSTICANEINEKKLKSKIEELDNNLIKYNSVSSSSQQFYIDQIDSLKEKLTNLEQENKIKTEEAKLLHNEKDQIETQLNKMQIQQRNVRAELDLFKDELDKAQNMRDSLERSKRTLESERIALKTKVETAENQLSEMSLRLINAENFENRLIAAEKQLIDKTEALLNIESENRSLKQQIDLETRKTQRLREDLINERSRISDLVNRLRSICGPLNTILNKDNNGLQFNEISELDDLALIDKIDEILISAINSTRCEADLLRLQQQIQIRELNDLKNDIEILKKSETELCKSDEKYNETLTENKNIKEQISILQERLRRVQIEETTQSAKLQAAHREIEELQQKLLTQNRQSAELSNLQIALRNLQLQEELLKQDQLEISLRLENVTKERNEAQNKSQTLSAINQALAVDHEQLQSLHQTLTIDYEQVKNENNLFKQRLKIDKNSYEKTLREEFNRERAVLEETIKQEMSERERHYRNLVECKAELARTSNELLELRRENTLQQIGSDTPCYISYNNNVNLESQFNELRRLRLLECAQKSTINNLNMTIQQLNNLLTEKDLEIANLRRQIDMLRQYNGDESRSLIRQIELLLIQNQQLHTRSDAFYAEQKELQEKLAQLRRHKEKLEEKIMDQYKTMDSRKIEPKPTFVRRAAKALISKSPGRKPSTKLSASQSSDSQTLRCATTSSSNTSNNCAFYNPEDNSIYSTEESINNTPTSQSIVPLNFSNVSTQSNESQNINKADIFKQNNTQTLSCLEKKIILNNNDKKHGVTTMLTSQNLLCSITPQTSQQKYKSVAQTSYNSNLLNNDKNSVLLQQNHKQTPDLYIKDNKLDKFNSTINRRTLSLTSSSMNCEFKNKQNLNNNDCNKKISSSIADDNLYYFNKTSTISSNTSTALSRFFQRSSPFRRSIATCSVYSSSSTSGYSGISSASPKSSVKLKISRRDALNFTQHHNIRTSSNSPISNNILFKCNTFDSKISNSFNNFVKNDSNLKNDPFLLVTKNNIQRKTIAVPNILGIKNYNEKFGGSLRYLSNNSIKTDSINQPLKNIIQTPKKIKLIKKSSEKIDNDTKLSVEFYGVEQGIDVMSKSTPLINCHLRQESADLPPRVPLVNQNTLPQYNTLSKSLCLSPPSYLKQTKNNNNTNNLIVSNSTIPQPALQKNLNNSITSVAKNVPPPPQYQGQIIMSNKQISNFSPKLSTLTKTDFSPRNTSTPKLQPQQQYKEMTSLNSNKVLPSNIVSEGSDRSNCYNLAKRQEKAVSIYENVNSNSKKNNIIYKKIIKNSNINNSFIKSDNNSNKNNNNINKDSEYLMLKTLNKECDESDKIKNNEAVWLEYGCV